jgi:hypothetical protein
MSWQNQHIPRRTAIFILSQFKNNIGGVSSQSEEQPYWVCSVPWIIKVPSPTWKEKPVGTDFFNNTPYPGT